MTSFTSSAAPFRAIPDIIRDNAIKFPDHPALVQESCSLTYAALNRIMNRVATALQRDKLKPGDVIAICASSTPLYAAVFLGAVRAGVVVAPLATSVTKPQFDNMLRDSNARILFADAAAATLVTGSKAALPCISLDPNTCATQLEDWLADENQEPEPINLLPDWPFNIIYSSGTTGEPKGIVQSHGMRWAHVLRGADYGYSVSGKSLLATPLYSNTTLVTFLPTLAYGGTVHLMLRFDAMAYLEIAQREKVSHTMLVPVQYQRIMALKAFDRFDLSFFKVKFCTSSPFSAKLKAEVLNKWPGQLVEIYGMTEGGGTCVLHAHEHPDKLHTVGKPVTGHDIRLINDAEEEVAAGETGEIVGHSPGMMQCYHNQPGKTREVEWYDTSGKRFIRTGDLGYFDEDGFLILVDRKKDMIISGGFNIYPSDLENELVKHPAITEAAVIAAPSDKWGETPVAFVVPEPGHAETEQDLLAWFNKQVGATQRLADLQFIEALPRNAIGKVMKRDLRKQLTP